MYAVDPEKCNGCNQCLLVCQPEAITVVKRKARIDERCVDCHACVKVCPVDAVIAAEGPGPPGSLVCHACPVLCCIPLASKGACQNFINEGGLLLRCEPVASYAEINDDIDYDYQPAISKPLLTGIGAGTSAPCYRPSPYIVEANVQGVDVVSCVTECIFSLCEMYVKVDTDEYLGKEGSPIIYRGNRVGVVTTPGYGSQNLSLAGPTIITGTNTQASFSAVKVITELAQRKSVTLRVEEQARLVLQLGKPPIINGHVREKMKFACGSATLNLLSKFFRGAADEVVALDDVYTGLYTELAFVRRDQRMPRSGLGLSYVRNTPGRYYGVPGSGWGHTDVHDPVKVFKIEDPERVRPGFTVLVTEPTGRQAKMYRYNEGGDFEEMEITSQAQSALSALRENTESTTVSVLFIGGAGGSARGGVTEWPLRLTKAVHKGKVRITVAGVPTFILPGGGITFVVDVGLADPRAFSWVPSPAVTVAMEYTMTREDFLALGGHRQAIRPLEEVLREKKQGSRFRVPDTGW